ncbi:Four-domain proteases inhibitor [Portunus trituberculatus]|uniref:Four-domain proteases inhibitor n=1 Tax=Portunus trituberculatus TaxID=210409 RepID=A0A5B7GYC4_PORTR|nr:Four-domain proteases inhibitor [Portunus trituberculatus]
MLKVVAKWGGFRDIRHALPPCDRPCEEILQPVCGTDGKTYDNDCFFKIAKCKDRSLDIKHDGECDDGCPVFCPLYVDPVCGTDGRTYGNYCTLAARAKCEDPTLNEAYPGVCKNGW